MTTASDVTFQFISLCWSIYIVYWIVAAFAVKRTIVKTSPGWRILPLVVLAVAFVLFRSGGRGLSVAAATPLWQPTLAVGVVADVVVAAGLAIAMWARIVLGGNWSGTPSLKENHELIERGPYAFVRHPIYSGMLLMLLATGIAYGRAGVFAVLAAVFIGLWLKALQEERLLLEHFPQTYPQYRARVKALIPFVF